MLFDQEFEYALSFLKKSKAIFSVCDVITRKVYYIIFGPIAFVSVEQLNPF